MKKAVRPSPEHFLGDMILSEAKDLQLSTKTRTLEVSDQRKRTHQTCAKGAIARDGQSP
jgi:hypothetical protein